MANCIVNSNASKHIFMQCYLYTGGCGGRNWSLITQVLTGNGINIVSVTQTKEADNKLCKY